MDEFFNFQQNLLSPLIELIPIPSGYYIYIGALLSPIVLIIPIRVIYIVAEAVFTPRDFFSRISVLKVIAIPFFANSALILFFSFYVIFISKGGNVSGLMIPIAIAASAPFYLVGEFLWLISKPNE